MNSRPSVPYAPSFSWASVKGPVAFFNRYQNNILWERLRGERGNAAEVKPLLTIMEIVSPELFTTNPYGPAESFSIRVHGQILPVEFDTTIDRWQLELLGPRTRPVDRKLHVDQAIDDVSPNRTDPTLRVIELRKRQHPTWDVIREPGQSLHTTNGRLVVRPIFIFDVFLDSPEVPEAPGTSGARPTTPIRGYHLIRAGCYIWGGELSTSSTEVVALILERVGVAPDGTGVFVRKGIALHAFDADRDWGGVLARDIILV